MEAQERREPWATTTESDLLEAIEGAESVTARVRSLECRSSVCLAEVASTPHGVVNLERSFPIASAVNWKIVAYGSEQDAHGVKWSVLVLWFENRPVGKRNGQ
jgi:hypothetical protein